jgi:hypothetical protein
MFNERAFSNTSTVRSGIQSRVSTYSFLKLGLIIRANELTKCDPGFEK